MRKKNSSIGKAIFAGIISAGIIAILYGVVGGLWDKDFGIIIVMPLLIFGNLILPLIGAGLLYSFFIKKWTENKSFFIRLLIFIASMTFALLMWTLLDTLFYGFENLKEFVQTYFRIFNKDFLGRIPALILTAFIMDYLFNKWDFSKSGCKDLFNFNNFLG